MALLLGTLIGKAVTGITNLVKNAQIGKSALAQGFVPASNPSITISGTGIGGGTAAQPGTAIPAGSLFRLQLGGGKFLDVTSGMLLGFVAFVFAVGYAISKLFKRKR